MGNSCKITSMQHYTQYSEKKYIFIENITINVIQPFPAEINEKPVSHPLGDKDLMKFIKPTPVSI